MDANEYICVCVCARASRESNMSENNELRATGDIKQNGESERNDADNDGMYR
jgi:hypothetical protein